MPTPHFSHDDIETLLANSQDVELLKEVIRALLVENHRLTAINKELADIHES
jgi:regulator of replication initiation timing